MGYIMTAERRMMSSFLKRHTASIFALVLLPPGAAIALEPSNLPDGNFTTLAPPATVEIPLAASSQRPQDYLTESMPTSDQPYGAANGAPAQNNESQLDEPEPSPAALDMFRAELDPYGTWVDDPNYGRVWLPTGDYVGKGFTPYVSNGQWALDGNDEWTWASDYPFGDVVFHYGRWAWLESSGWAWIPGFSYASAWVVWRVPIGDYAYVGWAPAPPQYGWFGGTAAWLVYNRPLPFVFCPSRSIFSAHVASQLVTDRYLANTLVHHSVWNSSARGYSQTHGSPSLARARVPRASAPVERVAANPRIAAVVRMGTSPSLVTRDLGRTDPHDTGSAERRSAALRYVRTLGVARPNAADVTPLAARRIVTLGAAPRSAPDNAPLAARPVRTLGAGANVSNETSTSMSHRGGTTNIVPRRTDEPSPFTSHSADLRAPRTLAPYPSRPVPVNSNRVFTLGSTRQDFPLPSPFTSQKPNSESSHQAATFPSVPASTPRIPAISNAPIQPNVRIPVTSPFVSRPVPAPAMPLQPRHETPPPTPSHFFVSNGTASPPPQSAASRSFSAPSPTFAPSHAGLGGGFHVSSSGGGVRAGSNGGGRRR